MERFTTRWDSVASGVEFPGRSFGLGCSSLSLVRDVRIKPATMALRRRVVLMRWFMFRSRMGDNAADFPAGTGSLVRGWVEKYESNMTILSH